MRRVAMISGASRGIGLAIARELKQAGLALSLGIRAPGRFSELLAVNVKAPFRLIRAALPHLKASGSGRVVNVASLSGKRVMGLNAGYQMSKPGHNAVRRIGWEHGIRATALCPGFVDTELVAHVTDVPHDQ